MNTLIATMILLLSWTQVTPRPVATPAGRPAAPVQNRPPQPIGTASATLQPVQPMASLQMTLSPGDQGLWGQVCQTVLVVPTPELLGPGTETSGTDSNQSPSIVNGGEPEGTTRMAQITEDMTVMCRILDKVVAPAQTSQYAVRINGVTRIFSAEESRTQGLYLAGYGALFFVPVDFPLRPPQQEQPQPQGESTADPVWAQTVEELRGAPAEGQQSAVPVQAYDAQQVENLKAALIKSLRHAANLRLASAQDVITLVVGPQDVRDARLHFYPGGAAHTAITPGRTRSRSGTLRAGAGSAGSAQTELASALILRVSKADVDRFAKGEIPVGTFTEQVQTLWSWTNRGPAEPPTTVRYERYNDIYQNTR